MQTIQPAEQQPPPWLGQTLFSDNFLRERLPLHQCWTAEGLEKIHRQLSEAYTAFREVYKAEDEENTRHEWIDKVLQILGWEYDREVKTRTGRPDYALFMSHEQRRNATNAVKEGPQKYYQYALSVLEAKYWDRPLDNVVRADRFDTSDPSGQIARYLSDLDIHTDSKLQWGILTNGRTWRLFWHRARSRATNYYEVDLVDVLERPHRTDGDFARLLYFVQFFEPNAFLIDPVAGENRLTAFVNLSERYALRVSENLKKRIFDTSEGVFIRFARGFRQYADDYGRELGIEGYQSELFVGTVTLLYRLLFLLYAESRNLLPISENSYFRYSLRRICNNAAEIVDSNAAVAETSTNLWTDLLDLFGIIRNGSRNLNIPVYNGGLFEPCFARKGSGLDNNELTDFFEDNAVYDEGMAYALDALAREVDEAGNPAVIDYKALGVPQLGSIYEGLLEFQLRIADEELVAVSEKNREVWKPAQSVSDNQTNLARIMPGTLYMVTNRGERKNTGSYYTPDYLVQAIIERAVDPVLEERLEHALKLLADYADARHKVEDKRRSEASRHWLRKELDKVREDLFAAVFDMRILDPAMGSGHFLVEAADHVANRIIDFLNSDKVKNALDNIAPDTERQPEQPDPENPLIKLIASHRETIVAETQRQGITINAGKLTDNNLIKRLVMKRCLYGVDLNPMAVELAKLSLWLHSFTLGAPLSFLDHHLRVGNSLVGIRDISQVIVPGSNAFGKFQNFMSFLNHINTRADASLEEIRRDQSDFDQSQIIIEPYRNRFNFRLAARQFVDMKGVNEGRLEKRCQTGKTQEDDMLSEAELHKLTEVKEAADEHRFFHWQLEFPEVFYDANGLRANAGFDAVIGNPPWERMKLQDIEFFGLRDPAIAAAPTAARRHQLIADLKNSNPELAEEYARAQQRSKLEMDYARKSGDYPLLGRGDVNLYSLFVERSLYLTAPHGRTGLLTPSGIASDNTSRDFFRAMTESGRLAEFIDFENKKIHFPDVHASFKFAISIITGTAVAPGETRCAFFIHHLDELNDPEQSFVLTPDDFALLNPNTRTCPIFRTRSDAELTKKIYRAAPILVDENNEKDDNPWSVRFLRMFDMTNDSNLFRTAEQLESDGFWHGTDYAWHKGQETYVRLYEGKMVQMFDHRAARVIVDPNNLFRPARPEPTTAKEKAAPDFTVKSQFYVPKEYVIDFFGNEQPNWLFGYKDVTASTNMRTIISSPIPFSGAGNTFCLIRSDRGNKILPCLLANFSTFALDYTARQKVHGQHLNFFVVKQLPVLPPTAYEKPFKGHDIRPWIRERVLELTYTAEDMRPFAADLGCDRDPFIWDDERRLHLRCQLDALYFHLYNINKEEIGYILDTFPIVRSHDEKTAGYYRTKDLIQSYWTAYNAGDLDAEVRQ